jgi:hypothetical protein
MEWFNKVKGLASIFFQQKQSAALSISSVMSLLSFLGNLGTSLSDGKIDGNELHNLMLSANSIELVILFGLLIAMKYKA